MKISRTSIQLFLAGLLGTALSLSAAAPDAVGSAAKAATGFKDNKYSWPRKGGEFDALTIGPFQPTGVDQRAETQFWGLPHVDIWTDLTVTDKAGTTYSIAHDVMPGQDGKAMAVGLSMGSESTPENRTWQPNSCAEPWVGVTEEMNGENVVLKGTTDKGASKTVTFGPERASWKTGGPNPTDLEGRLATPGTQWLLPWRDASGATGAMFYQNQIYLVHGTYCGKPVTGQIMIENVWSEAPYVRSWWVNNRAGSWAIWVNEYEDGTREHGQFLCGQYGATGAVIVNDRGEQVLNTTSVSAELRNGDIVYKFGDGQQWEFNLEAEVSLGPSSLNRPIKNAYGLVQRVGEKRKVLYHFGYRQINRDILCPVVP